MPQKQRLFGDNREFRKYMLDCSIEASKYTDSDGNPVAVTVFDDYWPVSYAEAHLPEDAVKRRAKELGWKLKPDS